MQGEGVIDFYDTYHHFYFKRTCDVDPSGFLGPFVRYLSPGDRILDVGCGSGRDLKWLKEKGFQPIGIDRAPRLAAMAAAHSGCQVQVGDAADYPFDTLEVDALMASGSLVHIPHASLEGMLLRMLGCLKPGGVFYLSLKAGRGEKYDAFGRRFYLWQEADLERVFARCRLEVRDLSVSRSALNSGDTWLGYVLFLC
ncbi:MAG: methyltransferase type 11 [Deltaproteobacteria bacterium]|nr:MAG: methyltransferase type 11 [Deltaproteobacteria bacterium]